MGDYVPEPDAPLQEDEVIEDDLGDEADSDGPSEVDDDTDDVDDDASNDQSVAPTSYDVTSYGSDPDVDGLVRKMDRGDILIPHFQRDYVWRQAEASRFIESLLLGLPVPGVFFATDPETNKQLVIDGQQRLKSLQFFYAGYFNPKPTDKRRRVFTLQRVQDQFEGLTYDTLEERDRTRLDNAIIHATVVKQASPEGDDTSMYHIFERLNSGGRKLTQQEIRVALYHGPFMDLVRELNELEAWRSIFGAPSKRLKDQELIIRFFALLAEQDEYARPMAEFLSKFSGRHRKAEGVFESEMSLLFQATTSLFLEALGREAFRPVKAVNAAVLDSCMVGLARRLAGGGASPAAEAVAAAYRTLFEDADYVEAVSRSTADEKFVTRRISLAVEAFAKA